MVAPQLGSVNAGGNLYSVVFVGTGRYLGTSDITSSAQQSIYGIKDVLGNTSLGDVRGSGTLVPQPVSNTNPRIVGSNTSTVDWTVNNGWYADLLSTRERVVTEMQLAFNELTVAANIPGDGATDCTPAGIGTSWLYQLNISSGQGEAIQLGSMIAGVTAVKLPSGLGVFLPTLTTGQIAPPVAANPAAQGGSATAKRSSWRELLN